MAHLPEKSQLFALRTEAFAVIWFVKATSVALFAGVAAEGLQFILRPRPRASRACSGASTSRRGRLEGHACHHRRHVVHHRRRVLALLNLSLHRLHVLHHRRHVVHHRRRVLIRILVLHLSRRHHATDWHHAFLWETLLWETLLWETFLWLEALLWETWLKGHAAAMRRTWELTVIEIEHRENLNVPGQARAMTNANAVEVQMPTEM